MPIKTLRSLVRHAGGTYILAMDVLSPIPKKPLAGAVILAITILAAAVVWRFYGNQIMGLIHVTEVIKPVVFTPISGPLADRAKFAVVSDAPRFLSTTLPISIAAQKIDFAQSSVAVPSTKLPSNLPNTTMGTDDDDDIATRLVPVKSAWLVRFSNAQLCNSQGACPFSIVIKSDDDRLVQGVALSTTARNIWVSSNKTNGNPDLIVDYGVPNQLPVRLTWQPDGEFPAYGVANPDVTTTLPPPAPAHGQ